LILTISCLPSRSFYTGGTLTDEATCAQNGDRLLLPLFQLRSSVTQNVMLHLVTSLVLQCIDNCNYILINLSTSAITPLQRVHNTAPCLNCPWSGSRAPNCD